MKNSIKMIGKALMVCFLPLVAFAAQAPLEEAPVALEERNQTTYQSNGIIKSTSHLQYTILKSEGIQAVSNIAFTYREKDRMTVKEAVVIQPDGRRLALKKSQIDTRLIQSPGVGFSNEKRLSFLFPKLKVGSKVELTLQRESQSEWKEPWAVQLTFLPQAMRINSSQSEYIFDKPLVYKAQNMEDFDVHLSEDKKRLVIQQKGTRYPLFINEPSNSYVRKLPSISFSTTTDLQACFAEKLASWNHILQAPLPESLAKVVKAVEDKSPEERVGQIMQYIRDHYRYLGDWRVGKRDWQPFSLAEIAQHGYGDCKDLSVMLVAMLRASGIDAEPAMVTRALMPMAILLPNVISPNHAIVRANMGDKVWWLDPTNPAFLPGYMMSDIHDRWVLVFGKDNQVRLEDIPRQPSEQLTEKRHETRVYSPNGEGTAEVSINYGGATNFWFAMSDYRQGAAAVNRQWCGGDTYFCRIKRDKTGSIVPAKYFVTGRYKLAQAPLTGNSRELLLNADVVGLKASANLLKRYKDHQDQGDLILAAISSIKRRMLFKNLKLIHPPQAYKINSPWYDITVKWHYLKKDADLVCDLTFIRKVDWLDHETIMSQQFGDFIKQLDACAAVMNQVAKVID